jgi:hypothetical protein
MQLDQYLEYLDRSSVLVITSEALRNDRSVTLAKVFRFLGVDASWNDPTHAREFHATSEKRVLRGFFDFAHRLPAHNAIARRIPESVKDRTFRYRTRGIDPALSTMADEVRHDLESVLRDDVRALRAYFDDSFDGWGIA